jgi:hypothetical protein
VAQRLLTRRFVGKIFRLALALVGAALLAGEPVGATDPGYVMAWVSPSGGARMLALAPLGNAVLVGFPGDYGYGGATLCDGRTGRPFLSLPSVIAGSDSGGMGFAVAASERGLLVSVPGSDEVLRFDTHTGEPRMAYHNPTPAKRVSSATPSHGSGRTS